MPDIPGYVALISVSPLDATCRLLVAFMLGGVIGFNRERLGKPAGLRTHIMVTLGSCVFLIMGVEVMASYSQIYETQLDPTRVLQGVVGGIGFLGAGSIIQSRGNVEGITTAATVWVSGAIGAGCGLGHYALVVILVGFCLITLYALGRCEFAQSRHKVSELQREDDSG